MHNNLRYRRALVTGGAGFIGSHIARRLIDEGMEVTVIDDLSMGRRRNVPKGARLIIADILDFKALKRAMKGAEVVFHNAAKVSIRNSFDNLYDDANVNVMGTINVLRSMRDLKAKKIIYASSMAVYGRNPLPVREDGLLEPVSPYGAGKLASEKYCLLMSEFSGFDCVALRYFNTYGPRQTFTPYVGVITIFTNRLLQGKTPVVFGSGEQKRDFIHVDDIVEANILSMRRNIRQAVVNVGTGKGTTVNEIARLLIGKIDPGVKVKHAAPVPGEPADSVAYTGKAEKIIGFRAKLRLQDRISDVIEWIRHEGIAGSSL